MKNKGFTLIEVAVAMVIFMMVVAIFIKANYGQHGCKARVDPQYQHQIEEAQTVSI